MKGDAEDAKVPLVKLSTEQSGTPWIDAKGMDVCSVDSYGVINTYDLTKAVNSYRGSTTTVEHVHTTTIDNEYSFHSTCISLNALDSTILVGSGEVAQIACWDTRSPITAATTSFACQFKSSTSSGLRSFDPIYGIEWNPLKSNEFMTVHPHTIRVWDTRKMNNDVSLSFLFIVIQPLYSTTSANRKTHMSSFVRFACFRHTPRSIPWAAVKH